MTKSETSIDVPPSLTLPTEKTWQIKASTLTLHVLTFITGVGFAFLIQNVVRAESMTFSTISLISFLFDIALSASSIVLAIAALALSKQSEQIMIARSDASIRLQNEVFVKTTDALGRIESSTGVTEKRIEDIISGRAGELSHAIAQRLGDDGAATGKNREFLEQEIRASLLEELKDNNRDENKRRMAERDEKRKKNRSYQQLILMGIANSGIATSQKVGDGSFLGTGDDLFDGVFVVGAHRVGVSVLTQSSPNALNFLLRIAQEIDAKRFHRVILVVEEEATEFWLASLSESKSVLKPDVSDAIITISGSNETVVTKIIDYCRSLLPSSSDESLKLASSVQK